MGYVIKIIDNNSYSNFHTLWKHDGSKSFSCVWDSDEIDFKIDDLRKIIDLGCVVFISIGHKADELHDTVDSIAETIQIDIDPQFKLDTRGSSKSKDTIADAVFELESCLFEEDKGTFSNVYIFTK